MMVMMTKAMILHNPEIDPHLKTILIYGRMSKATTPLITSVTTEELSVLRHHGVFSTTAKQLCSNIAKYANYPP